jgi:hypothetical protein
MVTKQRLVMSNIMLGSGLFILVVIGGGLMGWLPRVLPTEFVIFSLLLLVVAGRIRMTASRPEPPPG